MKGETMDVSFGIIDSVSYNIPIQSDIKSIKGPYPGRVPIDINPSGIITLSAKYLINGVWKDCILENGENLLSGKHRVWWNADEQLSDNLTTKLRVSINNMQTYITTDVLTVLYNPQDSIFPYFVIDNWNLPASGNPPSGQFVPLNLGGYTVKDVQFDMGQYLKYEDNLFMSTFGPSGVYPTSLICDTYSDFRELPASGISAEQVPGSVRLESYIGPVLVDRPNRIERKAENLLVYENTNVHNNLLCC
jgi:hypothetical protein